MKILIAGSHGMVGSAVTCHLIECGYEVIRLVRRAPGPCEVWWDPDAGQIDTAGLNGLMSAPNASGLKPAPDFPDSSPMAAPAASTVNTSTSCRV